MVAVVVGAVAFIAGVALADKAKAALSALRDKIKGEAKAELATVVSKVKEKL